MAPKREKSLLEDPPAASSSEDEEVEEEVEDEEEEEEEHEGDEEEEDEEEDDEEEEDEVTTAKPISASSLKKTKSDPTPNSVSKPQTPSSDDDEEEEDESEESDSEPTPQQIKSLGPSRGSNPSGKPIVSQPKKTVSKPSAANPTASPTKPSASAKRPLESEKDSKRKKKKVDDEDEEDSHPEESERRSTYGPKNIFQRLWSEDDEIVILKGMIESIKKGVDPLSDLNEFLDSIKKSLHVEVRQDQLNNKIRRLKKKYLNNFKRGKGGEDPVFSKPHEVLSYELMKEIWGGKEGNIRGGEASNGKGDSVLANGKRSRSKKSRNAVSPLRTKTLSLSDISMKESPKLDERNGSLHPCVHELLHSRNNMNTVGGSFFKQGLGLLGDSKKKDFEQKWRSLYAAELELYLKRVELVREQTIAILDAYKSSDTSEHE